MLPTATATPPHHVIEGAVNVANKGTSFMSEEELVRVRVESRRRAAASLNGGASTLTDGGVCHVPFKQASQQFALVNFANTSLRPQSAEPAFRVLGLFDSLESASDHALQIVQVDISLQKCNLHVLTTHAFYSIPQTQVFDINDMQEAVTRNLAEYNRYMDALTDEFIHHKEELTKNSTAIVSGVGAVVPEQQSVHEAQKRIDANKTRVLAMEAAGVSEQKSAASPTAASPAAASHPQLRARHFTYTPTYPIDQSLRVNQMLRVCEVRNQNYVSMMVLRDYLGDDREPAINLLGRVCH